MKRLMVSCTVVAMALAMPVWAGEASKECCLTETAKAEAATGACCESGVTSAKATALSKVDNPLDVTAKTAGDQCPLEAAAKTAETSTCSKATEAALAAKVAGDQCPIAAAALAKSEGGQCPIQAAALAKAEGESCCAAEATAAVAAKTDCPETNAAIATLSIANCDKATNTAKAESSCCEAAANQVASAKIIDHAARN